MTDIAVIVAHCESAFLDVAKQASGLAFGLQNAAPGNKAVTPNQSIQYLIEIAEKLSHFSGRCKKLLSDSPGQQAGILRDLIKEAVECDRSLREQYQIGDKFRFIRDRIHAAMANADEVLNAMQQEVTKKTATVGEDEVIVYVYLFNVHGITLQSWHKMVSVSIFYEHSVNRPIYTDKSHVEGFINRKSSKVQHGYSTVIIKKKDILAGEEGEVLKDVYDNPLIKVREGSLSFKKLISFTHNGIDYVVDEDGNLVRKE